MVGFTRDRCSSAVKEAGMVKWNGQNSYKSKKTANNKRQDIM